MCDAVALDATHDEETLLLERGSRCFVIMNKYPYNNGHVLIAPMQHEGDLAALDDETMAELGRLTQRWIRVLRAAMRAQGFNVGYNLGEVAGAGVADHVHGHVVPRWGGDANFMSVVADCRVVSQSLTEAWHLLREAASRLP